MQTKCLTNVSAFFNRIQYTRKYLTTLKNFAIVFHMSVLKLNRKKNRFLLFSCLIGCFVQVFLPIKYKLLKRLNNPVPCTLFSSFSMQIVCNEINGHVPCISLYCLCQTLRPHTTDIICTTVYLKV